MRKGIFKKFLVFVVCILFSILLSNRPSYAASFKKLHSKGYETSKLTQSASGSLGWYLSGEGKRYFCKMRVTAVYIGAKKMGIYTTAGRLIEVNRADYHKKLGVTKTDAPQMSNLKAGRPRVQDVGRCTFVK